MQDLKQKAPYFFIGALALVLSVPLLVVVTSPWHAPAPEWAHVSSTILPSHLGETLLLLAGTLLVALCIAVPTAWLVAVHDFPLRRFFRWSMVLPLTLPTYIGAFTYAALLGPTGSISRWVNAGTGVHLDIMNLPGLCVVLALVLFPYVYLPARAAFAKGMSSQLEAARLLGATGPRRFTRLGVPLARPAIVGGALLVAMETLNDYGAVKYFGIRTLTTGIFRSWGGLYDLGSALRLCVALLGLIALLLWIEKRSRKGVRTTTDQVTTTPLALTGTAKWSATIWCCAVLFFAAGLPLYKIIGDVLSSSNMAWAEVLPALQNTLMVAALAAFFILLISIAFTFRDRYAKRYAFLERIASLGYAIPGAVIALGVMAAAGFIDRQQVLPFVLIGSLGLITYAFLVRFLAVGTQPLQGTIRQQSKALDESARLLGASPWRAYRTVNLPLLRPALLAASVLVAIDVIKELPLTLILRPFNFSTLSTKAYEYANIEMLREASFPALLIVLCGLLPVYVLDRMMERKV